MKFPILNQSNERLPELGHNVEAGDDCGWECVAMVVAAYRGLDFSAGSLRQASLIPATEWGGRAGELATTLQGFRIRCKVKTLGAQLGYEQLRKRARAGLPSIILGRWLVPTVLHWLLVTDGDAWKIHVNDPYGGRKYPLFHRDYYGRAEGTTVLVLDKA